MNPALLGSSEKIAMIIAAEEEEMERVEVASMAQKYRRGKLCCCDKEVFVHRFTLTMILLDFVFLGFTSAVYISLLLSKTLIDKFTFLY